MVFSVYIQLFNAFKIREKSVNILATFAYIIFFNTFIIPCSVCDNRIGQGRQTSTWGRGGSFEDRQE